MVFFPGITYAQNPPGNNNTTNNNAPWTCTNGSGSGGGGAASSGPGGSYVPVYDRAVESAVNDFRNDFNTYRNTFNTFHQNFCSYAENMDRIIRTNPNSLRNVLAGNPSGDGIMRLYLPDENWDPENGSLTEDPDFQEDRRCRLRPVVDYPAADPDPGSSDAIVTPWRYAFNTLADPNDSNSRFVRYDGFGGTGSTTDGGDIMVNKSVSLSCLLQELVEWKKLSLFLQINSMIYEYIGNAQSTQLAAMLSANIAAANIAWARQQGIEICQTAPDGTITCTNTAVTAEDPVAYKNLQAQTQAGTIERLAIADPTDPNGSLGICQPFRADVTRNVAEDARPLVEKPMNSLQQKTQCSIGTADSSFTDETEYEAVLTGDINAGTGPQGGGFYNTFAELLADPEASPLGASTVLRTQQYAQLTQIKEEIDTERVSPGAYPTRECAPGDPNCSFYDQRVTGPQFVNREALSRATQIGDKMAQEQRAPNQGPPEALENQSVDTITNPGGLADYNVNQLTSINVLTAGFVRNMYETIGWAYYDTQYGTRKWAQAALLAIYDRLVIPNDFVTQTNQAAANSPLGTSDVEVDDLNAYPYP